MRNNWLKNQLPEGIYPSIPGYLSDNVYTAVTVGGDGGADVSLNIDLTPNVTARGSFSSDGTSSLGVFFERDY